MYVGILVVDIISEDISHKRNNKQKQSFNFSVYIQTSHLQHHWFTTHFFLSYGFVKKMFMYGLEIMLNKFNQNL